MFKRSWLYLLNELEFNKRKGSKVGIKINWKGDVSKPKQLKFTDLVANEAFRIINNNAVYIKVVPGTKNLVSLNRGVDGFMLEIASGKLFAPTESNLERINVEVNVDVSKPYIYSAGF